MNNSMLSLMSFFRLFLVSLIPLGFAQVPDVQVSPAETVQDLAGRLTPEQKQLFDDGMKAFGAQHYADALVNFKRILTELPGDPVLVKLSSEAALNTGDTSFAMSSLKPLSVTNPNDWQAAALLTRACAESGDITCRDAGMAHMLDLHNRGLTPPRMPQYILERIKAEKYTMLIRTSLEPWGPYKVYDLGQVSDSDGKIFLRITLESADGDQAVFAQQHPKEAADGVRRFTVDAYRETGLNGNGQRTQAHFTFKFYDGQPSYATLREEFIKIADGKVKALSSRTGLIVP